MVTLCFLTASTVSCYKKDAVSKDTVKEKDQLIVCDFAIHKVVCPGVLSRYDVTIYSKLISLFAWKFSNTIFNYFQYYFDNFLNNFR